jgi:hypothetical protein
VELSVGYDKAGHLLLFAVGDEVIAQNLHHHTRLFRTFYQLSKNSQVAEVYSQ